MVYGIDTNNGNISIATAKTSNPPIEFVIVKAGGANVPIYVATDYHTLIDKCIAASMPKGHYWIIGDKSTTSVTAQANYFTSHLYKFDKANDILALDNEPQDDNSTYWGDTDTAAFINQVKTNLGIASTQFWVYGSSGALFVDHAPWPKTISTGCRFWVAAWGTNNGTRVTPTLNGSIPTVDVQQYWTKATVAGVNPVDKDYSGRSIAELFGSWSGGGDTGTGTLVLSPEDRDAIQGYINDALDKATTEIPPGVWEHPMKSAIDNGSHWIQTYAAWTQRDTAAVIAVLSGEDSEFILVKEASAPGIWALNPQKGSKRSLTAGQSTVLLNCGLSYKTVADGSLAAFTTVT